MGLETKEEFKTFIFAISGLTLDEYAKKILDEFNQKEGQAEGRINERIKEEKKR